MATNTGFTPSDNPIANAMAQARSAAEDFTKLFSEMKLPPVPDMEALMTAYRRNMEALSAANRVALEGAQAVARRHMEIMQQTMTELTETMRALATVNAPQEKAAKQAELLKQAYEHAVANTRELSDLIQKSNGEALSLLNRRFAEAMDEVKALMEKAKTAG
ncbi:MAG TPA: TIGR01841 family phasin [Acetobacteraceae bacterium]|nr:TIGR01841 family phasin [Acetobacteraceae bacterium]